MGQIGGKNCVQNVLAGIRYGYANNQENEFFANISLGGDISIYTEF